MTALINGEKAPSNAWKNSFRLEAFGRSLLNWRTTSGLFSTSPATRCGRRSRAHSRTCRANCIAPTWRPT
ncbi:hypothetical protein M8494_16615 [Serratia ureilytica]